MFTLTSKELWWTSKTIRKSVKLADMGTVAEWSDIGIGHAFEIITGVKDEKCTSSLPPTMLIVMLGLINCEP